MKEGCLGLRGTQGDPCRRRLTDNTTHIPYRSCAQHVCRVGHVKDTTRGDKGKGKRECLKSFSTMHSWWQKWTQTVAEPHVVCICGAWTRTSPRTRVSGFAQGRIFKSLGIMKWYASVMESQQFAASMKK